MSSGAVPLVPGTLHQRYSFNFHVIVMRQTFSYPHLTAEQREARTGEVAWTGCHWWGVPGARISILAALLQEGVGNPFFSIKGQRVNPVLAGHTVSTVMIQLCNLKVVIDDSEQI